MQNQVTVAIPTYNAEEYLKEVLVAVFGQRTNRKVEVLVIDSGSTDQTLDLLKEYPAVRLHQIPNSEFGHGKTRNLAVELATGDYVLFLTQDAVPAHDRWLEAMVEPFELSEKVGAVLGKQIPRPDCAVTIKREVHSVFSSFGADDSVILHRKNTITEERKLANTFMSNANSAVRKSIHSKIPFRDVEYAEDQGLGIDLLDAGYYKAYAPLGSVFHSHNYGVREYFRRKYDEYVGLRKTTGFTASAGWRELTLGTAKATLKDWAFLVKDKEYSMGQKFRDFLKAPFYNLSLRLAIRAAANHSLSSKMHDRLSLEANLRKNKNR